MNQDILNIMTSKQRADKALSSLKGILQGINLDQEINKAELVELENWVNVHDDLISRQAFNEFMGVIRQTLSEPIVDSDNIEDLYWLIQKYETDEYSNKLLTSEMHILQGLCHGILSDGVINDTEIYGLKEWIEKNKHLKNHYPYDEIHTLLLNITADKIVTDQERNILKAYFNEFVKIETSELRNKIENDIQDIPITSLYSTEFDVEISGFNFCLTGIMQRYSRRDLEREIQKHGGSVKKTVTESTNYLIVADSGNPAWAFNCYGRKVEAALNLRKKGHNISIIHEFSFCDILDDLG